MSNNDISSLLPLYMEGRTTKEQSLKVEEWMAESEENRMTAEKAAAVYQFADTDDKETFIEVF